MGAGALCCGGHLGAPRRAPGATDQDVRRLGPSRWRASSAPASSFRVPPGHLGNLSARLMTLLRETVARSTTPAAAPTRGISARTCAPSRAPPTAASVQETPCRGPEYSLDGAATGYRRPFRALRDRQRRAHPAAALLLRSAPPPAAPRRRGPRRQVRRRHPGDSPSSSTEPSSASSSSGRLVSTSCSIEGRFHRLGPGDAVLQRDRGTGPQLLADLLRLAHHPLGQRPRSAGLDIRPPASRRRQRADSDRNQRVAPQLHRARTGDRRTRAP